MNVSLERALPSNKRPPPFVNPKLNEYPGVDSSKHGILRAHMSKSKSVIMRNL